MLKKIPIRLANIIFLSSAAIILAFSFIQVDLSLVYHVQQPFFANNFKFLENYLSYPGGISDYFGLFVMQFYGNASIALTLVIFQIGTWFFLIYQLVKNYLPTAYLPVPQVLSAIPLIIGLGSYFFPAEISIAFILSIGFAIIYRNVKLKNTCNYLMFFLISILDYYTSGSIGLSVFLAITVAFFIFEKKYSPLLIFVVWVALLPFLWHLFDQKYTSLFDAYCGQFIKDSYDSTTILITYYTPILIFIILLFSLFLSNFLNKANVTKWLIIFNFIIVLPVIFLITFSTNFNPALKNTIQLDKLAYEEKWDELLSTIGEQNIRNESVHSLVNRALYHKGILLDYLFYYPQTFHQEALIMKDPIVPFSEIYFDLGFINESRHWANEALIILGKRPRILKNLAESYIITGQYNTAEIYLNILESSFITKTWALEHRKYLNCDSCIENDPKLGRLRKLNPTTDFFAAIENPYDNLNYLIADSIPNQMAFEYFIAHKLLTNEPGEVLKNINKFRSFGFMQLPKACQEAILLYKAATRINSFDDLLGYKIDKAMHISFNNFSHVLFDQYKGDREAAKNSLSSFSQTYWYYYLYNKPLKNENNEKGVVQQ